MAEYIDREDTINFLKGIEALHHNDELRINIINGINTIPSTSDVVEKEMILDFIEDNRPTDVQTDWERGCAYICDEIEKLLK